MKVALTHNEAVAMDRWLETDPCNLMDCDGIECAVCPFATVREKLGKVRKEYLDVLQNCECLPPEKEESAHAHGCECEECAAPAESKPSPDAEMPKSLIDILRQVGIVS
jgi:hypothetical protein